VIAATSSELANLEIALLARELNPTQRVVVRLTDPDFATAVRDAANVKLAVSIPALAAPAFAAALFGDKVQTLVSIGERTVAVVELTVQPNDPCLDQRTLGAAMVDYAFLPVAIAGQAPFSVAGIPRPYRLKDGDRLTVVMALPDLDRLLRREPAPAEWAVEVDSQPGPAAEALLPIVRIARGCSHERASALLAQPSFTLAERVTRGEAEELLLRVARERLKGRIVPAAGQTS
jgi:hypothetical protein